MKAIIRWAINNSPAMNVLMVAVLIIGAISAVSLRREQFPQFELEVILVSVPYPGASPEEVESGICLKIEEAVQALEGIKKITSISTEGIGSVIIELKSNVPDVQKTLNDVRSEVDRITTFPLLAEDPDIRQITMQKPAIRIGVIGLDDPSPNAEWRLREAAEKVRDDLLQLPGISQVEINGAKDFQIDIEISEKTLRKYGLTLKQVAEIIRRENLELPGGRLRTQSQEILLRGKNKQTTGKSISTIPLITLPSGVVLTVGDLGKVKDDFADTTSIHRINGKPGMVISVSATSQEDLLSASEQARNYAKKQKMPAGLRLEFWEDHSVEVNGRLTLLTKNGLQGLVLVFFVLAIFLEIRLAFWVAMGIPFSILAACAVLLMMGESLNMLSMFSFLMALGIVVDDAIVIGENIYAHRQQGKGRLQAAIEGTTEVVPSVIASVGTTTIAFIPMLYVTGVMGKFFAVLPVAMIAMLLASLFESAFILPCHLSHEHHEKDDTEKKKRLFGFIPRHLFSMHWLVASLLFVITFFLSHAKNYSGNSVLLASVVAVGGYCFLQLLFPSKGVLSASQNVNKLSSRFLQFVIQRLYLPLLKRSLQFPTMTLSVAVGILILSVGILKGGIVPWNFFPKSDANNIQARITFPDGTPSAITNAATKKIEETIYQLNQHYKKEGDEILRVVYRAVGSVTATNSMNQNERTNGSHIGTVRVELTNTEDRTVSSLEIIDRWRKMTGNIPGAESIQFNNLAMTPGGSPIEFKLLADAKLMPELEAAIEECKEKLSQSTGVFDVTDDSHPGKWEFQMTVKEKAKSMNISLQEIAGTVRSSYYGEEVMRLQRGRHEVKLMVRYPSSERRSLADFENIRVRAEDGVERPLTELVHVNVQRGYSEINRVNQKRSITVMADVDESQKVNGKKANASDIMKEFQKTFLPALLKKYPGISYRKEGKMEQTAESVSSLFYGFGIAMIAMYVLLTVEFRSYIQPLLVLMIIPFGIIGAIVGHIILQIPLTLFSVLGLVALSGVVVNDSIVLMDFINMRIKEGVPLTQALFDAGERRFRPVLLTSITTIAGLFPILFETSMQAQFLIPMATSLSFGLLLATLLVLILVPTLFMIYAKTIMPSVLVIESNEFHLETGKTVPQKQVPIFSLQNGDITSDDSTEESEQQSEVSSTR